MLGIANRQQRVFDQANLDQRFKAGLVGHWIGGGSGNTWFDRSGYGNHGTLNNNPTWKLNRNSTRDALVFNNVGNTFVDCGAFSAVDGIATQTIAFWGQRTVTSSFLPIGKRSGSIWNGIDVWNDGNIYWQVGTSSYGLSFSNDLLPHHFCMVFNGAAVGNSGRLQCYLDGNQVALSFTGTIPATTPSGIGNFYIGKDPSGSFSADGIFDEVRVYSNRAFSTAEVAVLADRQYNPITFPRTQVARRAGIAYDAASNSGYQTASASYSWSHTCTGSNRYLAVDIATLSVPGTTVSSITYNGAALSLIGVKSSGVGTQHVEQWGLANPTSGSNTIAVTLSASVMSVGEAVSYTGVHQTTPTEAFNSATAVNVGAADASVSITSIADKCWIHGACASDDATITANQTSRNNVTGASGSALNEDTGPISPAGAATLSVTNIGAAQTWVIAGYAIRPTTATSGTAIKFRRGQFMRSGSRGTS